MHFSQRRPAITIRNYLGRGNKPWVVHLPKPSRQLSENKLADPADPRIVDPNPSKFDIRLYSHCFIPFLRPTITVQTPRR